MRLAISNLSWKEDESQLKISQILQEFNVTDLELALWKENYADLLKGRNVASVQSILYGDDYNLFESDLHREVLILRLMGAISRAENVNCEHLVFGCPKNRQMKKSKRSSDEALQISNAVKFFREIADYRKHVTIAIEPISERYDCNFLTDFRQAVKFVKRVDRPNIKINLDLANISDSNVTFEEVKRDIKFVSHIHVSETDLSEIKRSEFLRKLVELVESDEDLNERLVFSIEAKDLTISEIVRSLSNVRQYSK